MTARVRFQICSAREAAEIGRAQIVLSLTEGKPPEGSKLHEHIPVPDGRGVMKDGVARAIVDFAERADRVAEDRDKVVIHCDKGIARSPAAAMAVMRRVMPDATPEKCATWVDMLTRGRANPDGDLVTELDAALEEDGALERAAASQFPDLRPVSRPT